MEGSVGRHTFPPGTTKRRTKTNLKMKNNRNFQKNQTVWQSANQGVKEETFIQTGRSGGDRQPGWRESTARWQLAGMAVSHLHADKPGFQHREIKTQNL